MALDTKKFLTRTASAAVFVLVLLGCVWLHPVSFLVFFAFVGFVGLFEFYKLAGQLGKSPAAPAGYLLHALLIASLFFVEALEPYGLKPYLLTLILACPLFLLVELFKEKASLFSLPAFLLGFLYVSVPCALLILLSKAHIQVSTGKEVFVPQKVLGMIFFIWINDTGAYLVGSFLGKHKMYERISPGKTWEGTVGGALLCLASAFLMVKLFPQLALPHWLAVAGIVAVFGTLGDLVESMMKRMAGVKDSGAIMPGHGGVLDRFDSLLFATPFVFAYLAATGNL